MNENKRDKSVINSNLVYHNKLTKIKAGFSTIDRVAYLIQYTQKLTNIKTTFEIEKQSFGGVL